MDHFSFDCLYSVVSDKKLRYETLTSWKSQGVFLQCIFFQSFQIFLLLSLPSKQAQNYFMQYLYFSVSEGFSKILKIYAYNSHCVLFLIPPVAFAQLGFCVMKHYMEQNSRSGTADTQLGPTPGKQTKSYLLKQ